MTHGVSIATDPADAAAVEAIEEHHAQLLGALSAQVESLLDAAGSTDTAAFEQTRTSLVDWCNHELLPHAQAEEAALYPAGRQNKAGRLLVAGMTDEHGLIKGLVARLSVPQTPVRAAATAHALRVLFESHMRKENEHLVPLLAAARRTSLAQMLADMHETLAAGAETALGGTQVPADPPHGDAETAHRCGCGEHDEGDPELDARLVPHAIRHATVFGALDALPKGGALVLVASHDPLSLLGQLEQRAPGVFDVTYQQRGPDAWRLRLLRGS